MPKITLIGISGRARSGKDTVADIIAHRAGGYKYGFANPIKQMLLALGIDMSLGYWEAHKETVIPEFNASPRRLMQTLGTEWGRKIIHPDLWLILAERKLKAEIGVMVVPDVRFENEATWVREQGGVIIHVRRDNAPFVEKHSSEHGIMVDHVKDYLLSNDGTLGELKTQVIQLLREIEHGH